MAVRWWRSPLAWSVWVHAGLLACVAAYLATRPNLPPDAPPAAQVGGRIPSGTPTAAVADDADRRLRESLQAAAALPPERQYADALKYAEQLERIGSAGSMREIGASFGKAMSFSGRQYAPVPQPPAGTFDVNSQLPYAVRRAPGKDGKPAKWLVWVDKDGRTKSEELTPTHPMSQNPLALAALERLQGSETLRSLKDEVLMKVMDKLLGAGPAEPPAGKQP